MKIKQIIKINSDLDFIYLNVNSVIHSRWPNTGGTEIKTEEINVAKIAAFDLLWEMTERGYDVSISPYLN